MLLWIMSDIHLESSPKWDLPKVGVRPDFDVLVIAGDLITRTARGVKWLLDRVPDRDVVYVRGNHECYGGDIERDLQKARALANGTNVHVLENDCVKIGGVEFVGSVFWTDYLLFGSDQVKNCLDAARVGMNDFRKIRKGAYSMRFTPEDARIRNRRAVEYLRHRRLVAPDERRVVVTHHRVSIAQPPDDGQLLQASYSSSLDELLLEIDAEVLISGHVHASEDRYIGRTRLVSNPKGYGPFPGEPADRWENAAFDPRLTITI